MKLNYIVLAGLLIVLPATASAHGSLATDKNAAELSQVTNVQTIDVKKVAKGVAHSGRTDSSGCHNDRKKGTYHCH